MASRKRYAVVGTGGRAGVFISAMAGEYEAATDLVALCDISPTRMAYHNRDIVQNKGLPPRPTYAPVDFEKMIDAHRPEVVLVTTPDYLHHEYIVRAMRRGCDVICEKPLTTDAAKLRAVFDAVAQTGRKLRMAFNVRYMPEAAVVKRLVLDGAVGRPTNVDMSWTLDTSHGADYFRRWHREKDKSGGLLIHKATHHFDLINWWIASYPRRVFCMAGLEFYGRKNAEARGRTYAYDRYTGRPEAAADPFAFTLDTDPMQKGLYFDAESDSGYVRDRNVFGESITTEDTAIVSARYRSGVLLNYSLVAYSPWEGLRVAITGTAGRVELYVRQGAHFHGLSEEDLSEAAPHQSPISSVRVYPMFGLPYDVPVPTLEGTHGGADPQILQHLFSPTPPPDPLGQTASHLDGAASALVGMSANESIGTGLPVDCDQLLRLP